jgi:hypothetical protein
MEQKFFLQFLDNLNSDQILNFLIEERLIYDSMDCLHCNQGMILTEFNKSILGLNWRCCNSNCDHFQTTLSIIHCSFFQNSPIDIVKYLKVILLN